MLFPHWQSSPRTCASHKVDLPCQRCVLWVLWKRCYSELLEEVGAEVEREEGSTSPTTSKVPLGRIGASFADYQYHSRLQIVVRQYPSTISTASHAMDWAASARNSMSSPSFFRGSIAKIHLQSLSTLHVDYVWRQHHVVVVTSPLRSKPLVWQVSPPRVVAARVFSLSVSLAARLVSRQAPLVFQPQHHSCSHHNTNPALRCRAHPRMGDALCSSKSNE
mmetsp:Transcript_30432/g.70985  ORF Transcript_30432/g.70985 Transcript_30432/m.70985 type:complete len:220 (+) Transcript_30432:136-795(+)